MISRYHEVETATVKETGKDVSINAEKLIASIDGDQVQIHTADGVKNIDEVDLSEDIQDIINKGKRNGMNAEEINAMVAAYDGSEYGEIYAAAYTDLYNEARLGTTRSAALENAKFSIGRKTANAAFDAGSARRMASLERLSQEKAKATRKAKSENGGKVAVREGDVIFHAKPRTDTQEQFAKFAEVFAKSAGVDVVLYTYETNPEMRGKSGKHVVYKNGRCEIWINLEAQNNRDGKWMLSTMAHELVHFMAVNDEKGFEIYKNFVVRQVGEARFNEVMARHITSENPSQEEINTAIEEAVAELSEGMLADGSAIRELAKTDLSTAQKIVEWICDFLQKVLDAFDGYTGRHQALINEAKADLEAWQKMYNDLLKTAVENYNAGQDGKSSSSDMPVERYSIEYTTDNNPVVQIRDNILDGVPKRQWVETVKQTIKGRFSSGIPVSGRLIKVNKITGREYTGSKNTQSYKSHDRAIYRDKFKAANHLDEIVLASTNYINEDLNHSRKDNFKEFARGDVLLQIGGNSYTAKVIVGFTTGGNMVLYDIVDFIPTTFNIKKVETHAVQSPNVKNSRTSVSTNNKVPQNDTVVNSNSIPVKENYSLTDEKLIDGKSINGYNGDRANRPGELVNEFHKALTKSEWRVFYKQIADTGRLQYNRLGVKFNAVIGNKLVLSERKSITHNTNDFVVTDVFMVDGDPSRSLLNELYEYVEKEGMWFDDESTGDIFKRFVQISESFGGKEILKRFDGVDFRVFYDHTNSREKNGDVAENDRDRRNGAERGRGLLQDERSVHGDVLRYSAEVLTDEEILSDEFLQTAQDAEERTALFAYRKAIQKTAAARAELAEVKQQIKDAYFSKGPRDQKWKDRMENLKARQAKLERDVDREFKALLKAEEARPLQELMQREIQRASGRKAKQGMERLQKNRESRNKAIARRKIQKTLNELNHLLTHGTKKKNVKAELQETVASALALGELLFNDEISNEDIVRAGVLSVTERESKLLNEQTALYGRVPKKEKKKREGSI